MSKIIGIDLGTTNSCVSVMEGGKPIIINNAEGLRTTPSVVAFTKKQEQLVGIVAKRQAVVNPENTFHSTKRLIGCEFSEVIQERNTSGYKIARNGSKIKLECPAMNRQFSAEEIAARILVKLKKDAESYLNQDITQAIITVPAYFNDAQRQATKDAGVIAGLQVLRIINEPVAAALAYGIDIKENKRILVFDLGGGTLDISTLEIGDGVFEVLTSSGDTHLGGNDFNQALVDYIVEKFKAEQGIDLREDKFALQRLMEAAESAKHELSSTTQTTISIPFIHNGPEGPINLEELVTRNDFNNVSAHLIDRCRLPLQQALEDARLDLKDIDDVILVGGSTRMPCIEDFLTKTLGKRPVKSINPDEAVALGAAIQAGVCEGDIHDILLLDVTPLTLGVRTKDDIVAKMIPRNTTIPTNVSKIFTTSSDNQRAIDIKIVQGERDFATDNKSLGLFTLSNLPEGKAGEIKVNVTFDIDANGLLLVTAKETSKGVESKVSVSETSALSEQEIEEIIRDANANQAQDSRSMSELLIERERRKQERINSDQSANSFTRLVGDQLLEKIRNLGDADKDELVRACGYVSIKKDGSKILEFDAFYEALLDAQGVNFSGGNSDVHNSYKKDEPHQNAPCEGQITDQNESVHSQEQYEEYWKNLAQMALQHGCAVITVPLTDDEGNNRLDKNGNPVAEFSYTYGNRQTGDAELLTFYPGGRSAHAVLNRLSKALEEERLPYPKNYREVVCAEGLLEETDTVVMYHALDAQQRTFTNEKYTTHHWEDEEDIPILHVIIPLPDGNFPPVTPQPVMPSEEFDLVKVTCNNTKPTEINKKERETKREYLEKVEIPTDTNLLEILGDKANNFRCFIDYSPRRSTVEVSEELGKANLTIVINVVADCIKYNHLVYLTKKKQDDPEGLDLDAHLLMASVLCAQVDIDISALINEINDLNKEAKLVFFESLRERLPRISMDEKGIISFLI